MPGMRRTAFSLLLGLFLAVATNALPAAEKSLTVFAAASLTDVLQDIGAAYTQQTGVPVRFSFAGSATLARQIEAGAPADAFVSADQQWMDYLAQRRRIDMASRTDVATNVLVLVAPADSRISLDIKPGFPLRAALAEKGRITTGDPDTVPAGRYARAAFQKLGVWDTIATRVVPADSVRAALNYVIRGEAALGVVYATDIQGVDRVREVARFPAGSHPPITYPAAVTLRGGRDAAQFVQFLRSATARSLLNQYGFGTP